MEQLEIVLDEIKLQFTALLRDNLVGIYLHGSASYGAFSWENSDIDLIVVIKSPLCIKTKLDLLAEVQLLQPLLPEKGIEVSFVLEKQCKQFVYPTPYELHFSKSVLPSYLQDPLSLCADDTKLDTDLAAHFHVINLQGIVVCGEEIEHVFSPISKEYLWNSLYEDVCMAHKTVLQNFPPTILSLCRVCAFAHAEKMFSKQEAVSWAVTYFDSAYHALIQHALQQYKNNLPYADAAFELQTILQFCDVALSSICAYSPAAL